MKSQQRQVFSQPMKNFQSLNIQVPPQQTPSLQQLVINTPQEVFDFINTCQLQKDSVASSYSSQSNSDISFNQNILEQILNFSPLSPQNLISSSIGNPSKSKLKSLKSDPIRQNVKTACNSPYLSPENLEFRQKLRMNFQQSIVQKNNISKKLQYMSPQINLLKEQKNKKEVSIVVSQRSASSLKSPVFQSNNNSKQFHQYSTMNSDLKKRLKKYNDRDKNFVKNYFY